MWLRLRLDIGWSDLRRGFLYALATSDPSRAQMRLENHWSGGRQDALACLSVRSGFDLLLQALALPKGSEVLFSAVTIPDMPRIVCSNGLVPVPVELSGSDFRVTGDSLRRALGPRSRALVLSHLFGGRPDSSEVIRLARGNGLYVIEDCAQAWSGEQWRGHEQSDASLFSFGPIKTATSLGGALCRIRDAEILERMRAIQASQPRRANRRMASKLLKYAGLKLASSRVISGLIVMLAQRRGGSLDDLLRGLTRAFPNGDLLSQLRQQPAASTLRLLDYRLGHYETARIGRRVRNARRIIDRLGLRRVQPELLDPGHTFWLFPLLHEEPEPLIKHLRSRGFDATQRGSLEIVAPPPGREEQSCVVAQDLLRRTVFLPCYPDMPLDAIDAMCELILDF